MSFECQRCALPIIREPGFPVWCDCGWGHVQTNQRALTRLERFVKSRNEKRGADVIKHVLKRGNEQRIPPIRLAFVVLVALPLFAMFLFCAGGAVLLLMQALRKPVLLIPAGLLLALGWGLRPRVGRIPKGTVGREEAPALFEVMDYIRNDLSGPNTQRLLLSTDLNASIGTYGLRSTRVVEIGMPLAAACTPLELVGVLAHEHGHALNGDPARGRFVYSTVASLNSLRQGAMFIWEGFEVDQMTFVTLVTTLVGLVFRLFAAVFGLMIYAIVRVTWWDRQVAELRADIGAAQIVGSQTMIDMLHKMEFDEEIALHIRATSLNREPQLANALMSTFRLLPQRARMLAKLRMANGEHQGGFDATHPSGKDRVAVLEQSTGLPTEPARWLTEELLTKLDRELQRLGEPVYGTVIELSRQFEAQHYRDTTPPWLRPAPK